MTIVTWRPEKGGIKKEVLWSTLDMHPSQAEIHPHRPVKPLLKSPSATQRADER